MKDMRAVHPFDVEAWEVPALMSKADHAVYEVVKGRARISRDTIRKRTGLSQSAVLLTCDRLTKLGLIGPRTASRRRRRSK